MSSDYMREASPSRDDDRSATNRYSSRRNDASDRPPVEIGARHSITRHNDVDQSAGASSTGRIRTKTNESDEYSTNISHTGPFVAKKDDEHDQSATASSITPLKSEIHNDEDHPTNVSNAGHPVDKLNDAHDDNDDVIHDEKL